MSLRSLFTLALGVSFTMFAISADAAILVNEEFSRADGNLVGTAPTPGPGNAWAAHSGAGNKAVQIFSGSVSLEQSGGSGEDINTSFSPQGAADTTYASFEFSLPSAAGQDLSGLDANGLYFAHLKDDGFGFRARTGVVVPTAGGDFGLALNADSSGLGAGSAWASDLSFDTTYKAVISWNADTGESNLWLDPVDINSTSISHTGTATGNLIESFALRQSNDFTGSVSVDNICVATTFDQALTCVPEPTAALLLVLGMSGLVSMRRR